MKHKAEKRVAGKQFKIYRDKRHQEDCPKFRDAEVMTEAICLRHQSTETTVPSLGDSPSCVCKCTCGARSSPENEMYAEEAPEGYWKSLAEKRREALDETLEENQQLNNSIRELTEENEKLSEIAKQADYFASVLSMMADDENNSSEEEDDVMESSALLTKENESSQDEGQTVTSTSQKLTHPPTCKQKKK